MQNAKFQDPQKLAAVTHKILITIARKKQARAMVTAWNKLKEKHAKEKTGGQRKERTAPTPRPTANG